METDQAAESAATMKIFRKIKAALARAFHRRRHRTAAAAAAAVSLLVAIVTHNDFLELYQSSLLPSSPFPPQ